MCPSQQLTRPPHPLRRWASKLEHLMHCHLQEKCFVFHSSTCYINNSVGNKTDCVSPYHAACPAKVSHCHLNTFTFQYLAPCHSASVTVRMLNVWWCVNVWRLYCINIWRLWCMNVLVWHGITLPLHHSITLPLSLLYHSGTVSQYHNPVLFYIWETLLVTNNFFATYYLLNISSLRLGTLLHFEDLLLTARLHISEVACSNLICYHDNTLSPCHTANHITIFILLPQQPEE